MKPSVLIVFFVLNGFTRMYSHIIRVGHSEEVQSLQEGFAIAWPGDTLLLLEGVYKEKDLVLTKSIHLMGEKNAVLEGDTKYEILRITGRNFSIQGIQFRNSGYSSMKDFAAIKIIDASDFLICKNQFSQSQFAIHVSNSHHFRIEENLITGRIGGGEQTAGNGIHLWKCSHAIIDQNEIKGHRDGIYFEFVTSSAVTNNHSHHNIRYGLHFMFSHEDRYVSNTFEFNGAGVAVMFSHHIEMLQNKFQHNTGGSAYGLLLKEISDGEIRQNQFLGNTSGAYLEGSNRLIMQKNAFYQNGYALRIQANCTENQIAFNNFVANTFDVTTNGSLVMNRFYNNYWDKYQGYDLNRDGLGDIPYHPLHLFAVIIDQIPLASILLNSFMVKLLDHAEKALPSITPQHFKDEMPAMKPNTL
jgi:nitrous oxidase accessory protein